MEALVLVGFLTGGEARAAIVIRTCRPDLADEEQLAEIRERFARTL